MNFFKIALLRPWTRRVRAHDSWMEEFGRAPRTFDIETIAPYDHMGLVAFLKAEKLTELAPREICDFLMLREILAYGQDAGLPDAKRLAWAERTCPAKALR